MPVGKATLSREIANANLHSSIYSQKFTPRARYARKITLEVALAPC